MFSFAIADSVLFQQGPLGANGRSYDSMYPPGSSSSYGPGMPGRSRTYGGYSDGEEARFYSQQQDHHHPHRPQPPGDPYGPGDPGGPPGAPYGPGPPPHHPPGRPHRSGPGRGRHPRHRGDPMDYQDGGSDIESVVSATSAFSSHSAPHARARRLG